MVEALLGFLGQFIQNMIQMFGPFGIGVVLAMAIESACIPLPSELIMPFAGYLVVTGFFKFGGEMATVFWVGMIGALGCLVGSVVAYAIGIWGGRPFISKYGKYILITHHDMDIADRFFNKHGEIAIFTSRLLPVIRTFISLPAGIAKMKFWRFCIYSMLGSIPWCWALTFVGFHIGKHATDINAWKDNLKHSLGKAIHIVDVVIIVAVAAFVYWYVRRHIEHSKTPSEKTPKKTKKK